MGEALDNEQTFETIRDAKYETELTRAFPGASHACVRRLESRLGVWCSVTPAFTVGVDVDVLDALEANYPDAKPALSDARIMLGRPNLNEEELDRLYCFYRDPKLYGDEGQ